eukprot:SAG31_NODE_1078_length_10032_cov_4.602034_3_plen_115_part_00
MPHAKMNDRNRNCAVDEQQNVQMGGTGALGDALAGIVKARLGGRVRGDTFGYIQRNFPVDTSPVDREEAFACGVTAVEAATSGTESGAVGAFCALPIACWTFATITDVQSCHNE